MDPNVPQGYGPAQPVPARGTNTMAVLALAGIIIGFVFLGLTVLGVLALALTASSPSSGTY